LSQKLNFYETFVANIWRNSPETKEQASIIYKSDHLANNIIEENKLKEKGLLYSFENRFPILPLSSISYFCVKDIRDIKFTKLLNKFMELENENDFISMLILSRYNFYS